jgi:DNA invertase Pin-like site-specific DNA recombinase
MKAVIYARVSTVDKQDTARQIQELKEYASYRKFTVAKVFEEKISGAVKANERTEFKNLLNYIEKEKIQEILVWEISRLGRSMSNVINTIEELSDKKINIYSKKEGFNTLNEKRQKDLMTNIIISVLSGFAEMERETFKAHSASGIRQNVLNGGSGTGVIKAYGFKKVDKKLVVDDEEAEIIRIIFNKYLSGSGTTQIANYLNELKIPTRYNKLFKGKEVSINDVPKAGEKFSWVDGTIYSILKNTIYKGDRNHKDEIFKVTPLINPEIFDTVQRLLKENYNKKNNTVKFENPLKDILKCGVCGRSYFLHKRTNGNDNAYKCLSKRYNKYCGNYSIGYDKINEAIYKTVKPFIMGNPTPEQKKILAEKKENNIIGKKAISKSILDFNGRLDRLFEIYVAGDITKTQYNEKKTKYEKELLKLDDKLKLIDKELDKVKVIENKTHSDNYNHNIFKQELKNVLQSIKIYPTTTDTNVFTYKNDKCVLVEINTNLMWNDKDYGGEAGGYFIISQHSHKIAFPTFSTETALFHGKYKLEMSFELDELMESELYKGSKFIKLR